MLSFVSTGCTSHPCNVSFKDGNVVSFWFPNLSLPNSSANELASHGFVTFKIKPKSNWIAHQPINNSAQIYFDFNLPITTNTVTSLLTNPTFLTLNESVCDSFLLNGTVYRSTGTFTQTLVNAAGFDSIITLNLTVNNYLKTINQNACETFTYNNTTYDSSGVYKQVFTNVSGCDSTIILNLTINKNQTAALTVTACETFIIGSQTYTTNGIYFLLLTTLAGCDSLVTLNLTISNNSYSSVSETACEIFTLNTITYDSSGVYTQVLSNAAGCDSTITLNLTLNKNSSSAFTKTACDTFTFRGQTYNSSGTYTSLLTNSNGCDSLITLNLTINQGSIINTTQVACRSYFVNGNTYTSSGVYDFPFINSFGCPSTWHLNLTINSIDTSVTQNGLQLISNQAGASYQWLDCDHANTSIPSQTYQLFSVASNGNYAVAVSKNLCSDTSGCYSVMSVGILEQPVKDNSTSIFPNPAQNTIFISSKQKFNSVRVFNAVGQLVISGVKDYSQGIDISSLSNGIYFMELVTAEKIERVKFVKR